MKRTLWIAWILIWSLTPNLSAQDPVPGVVVGHSHPQTEVYLGSPSLLILDDGTYLAAYQEFGRGEKLIPLTFVKASKDRGKSWESLASIKGLYWANLFAHQGNLYLFGVEMQVQGGYGPLVIRKSTDQGLNWTDPVDEEHGLIRSDQQYHTAPVPMLIHHGRIMRAVEDRNPPEKWGVNFRSLVISAPVDADLLKASSWTTSNRLSYQTHWPGNAWLEGNLVKTPDGRLVNILRNDVRPETEGGKACLVQVSDDGLQIEFDPQRGFIDFPGGCKKFTIRHDSVSGKYWSLSNYIPEEFSGGNPERTRNTLALVSSEDLNHWNVEKIILQHPDVEFVGFQYVDWRFDGNDLVALIRTAYPEPDGTPAHNCHDSNYITFYRIENFRQGRMDKATSSQKPNIILILADDLGYGDLGCYGQKKIHTPNLDQLASEGIRFTQAYAGGPVCTPSRCVLMTGLHNGHSAARDNVPHYHSYLQEEDQTMAEVLGQAGYTCGGVGKWSLGDWGTEGAATRQGFDMWFGYLNQDHAHYYYTNYLDDSYRGHNQERYELPGNPETKESYSHDLITTRALQFIRDSHDEPFFLYAAFTLPHFSAPAEDKDMFAVPGLAPYENKKWNDQSKKYAAMVHMLDRDVGRILALLDQLGLDENTLVLFASDNGGHRVLWKGFDTNGPLRGYKRDLTEGGIRVPFIARWPGTIPPGKVSQEIIAFQDLLPTVAELSGAEVPSGLDGVSMVEALQGKQLSNPHPFLYWDYGHCRDQYAQAVRMGPWKGIRTGIDSSMELYHLEQDLGEKHNIASKHPDVVREIERIMGSAYEPHPRYPLGEVYKGKPIWQPDY